MSVGLLCQLVIAKSNGLEGAQIFIVFPGDATPAAGFVEFAISITSVVLHPFKLLAVMVMSKTPRIV